MCGIRTLGGRSLVASACLDSHGIAGLLDALLHVLVLLAVENGGGIRLSRPNMNI